MALPDANFLDGLQAAVEAVVLRVSVVVRPAHTSEVAETVRRCAAAGVAVVSLGGDAGRSGETNHPELRPSIALSLTRMNAIEPVDASRSTITAQAGVTIEALESAAAEIAQKFALPTIWFENDSVAGQLDADVTDPASLSGGRQGAPDRMAC